MKMKPPEPAVTDRDLIAEQLAIKAAIATVADFMEAAHMWAASEIVNGYRVIVIRELLSRQRDDANI